MSFYIGREASKLWKRICAETSTELKLLFENWKYLLGGLICQYIHGLAARGVHYFHRPGPILQDVGYYLLPELGIERAYISETVFTFIFASFVLWTFHPFIFKNKKIYTVLLWCRVLAFLFGCQILRIITFYSTQLPGPNYHCREGSKFATLPLPDNILEVFVIIPRGVLYGCGDLIFSSHMIFSLVFVRTYQKYGTRRFIKQCAWLTVVIQSLLIIASRKHYTVDVVVAWYTVNLVVYFIDHKLPELPDRSSSALLLPVSKDSRVKEENHKLLNGNSVDQADWVLIKHNLLIYIRVLVFLGPFILFRVLTPLLLFFTEVENSDKWQSARTGECGAHRASNEWSIESASCCRESISGSNQSSQ